MVNTPVYKAGIQGNSTIQFDNIAHVQDDGWTSRLPLIEPPMKYQIRDDKATTLTYELEVYNSVTEY